MDEHGRHLVYSVTKTFVGVLCLRLEPDLDLPVATWIDDPRLPPASLRQLLNHTSGIADYGGVCRSTARRSVRRRPSPRVTEELLSRALAQGADFEPGGGWAYSNTGYLLVRRIVDNVASGGFAGALEGELLGPLELADTTLALELGDLDGLVPGRRAQIGEKPEDVRGRYHPCWVGHRTLASTAADQRRFWTALAAGELCDLARLTDAVEIGVSRRSRYSAATGTGMLSGCRSTSRSGPSASRRRAVCP